MIHALIGEHNFSSLSKNNVKVKNKVCSLTESYWEQSKNELIYHKSKSLFTSYGTFHSWDIYRSV